jgi:uncharacterized protein YqfA (UPF0365 family)
MAEFKQMDWIVADVELTFGQVLLFALAALFLLMALVMLLLFAKLFRLWLQAFLSGAGIPVVRMIGMMLRRTPVQKIVQLRIMGVQAGVPVDVDQIESAFLAGVDAERAVLAMIHAKQTGQDVTWEDLIREDVQLRLDAKSFDDRV